MSDIAEPLRAREARAYDSGRVQCRSCSAWVLPETFTCASCTAKEDVDA